MENKKIFGLLSMCRKSGRMALGFDMTKEAAEKGKAKLLLTACDLSQKTGKEVRFFAGKNGVKHIGTELTIDDFFHGIGKKVGVIAICDDGFARSAEKLLGESENEK